MVTIPLLYGGTGADSRYSRKNTGIFEMVPAVISGHSWQASPTPARFRWWERVASRYRMGTTTNLSSSGHTAGDLAMFTLGGFGAWTIRQKSVFMWCCLINDITLLEGAAGAAAQRGYSHAVRAMLSRVTANGVVAANTTQFAYSANWASVAVTNPVNMTTPPQANTVAATGGAYFRTTTVGSTVDIAFSGSDVDLVFIARAAGAGLITITNGGTTLGTLNLTAATGQDTPAIYRVRGLGAGSHTVRATLTSGASMTVDSYNIPSTKPTTMLLLAETDITGGVLPSGSAFASFQAAQAAYRALLAAVAAEFPTALYLDLSQEPGFVSAQMLDVDGKHPNDRGAAWIADRVTNYLTNVAVFSDGLNIVSSTGYPAAYAPPTGPAVPGGGQDGTGGTGDVVDATDTFASGTTLAGRTTTTGAKAWSIFDQGTGAVFGISGGAVGATAGTSNAFAVTPHGRVAGYVQATLATVPANNVGGLVIRSTDAANCIFATLRQTSSVLFYGLNTRVAAVNTLVGTGTNVAPAAGDVVRITDDGTLITLYVNGNAVWTYSSTQFNTIQNKGIYGNFAAGPGGTWSDYSMGH